MKKKETVIKVYRIKTQTTKREDKVTWTTTTKDDANNQVSNIRVGILKTNQENIRMRNNSESKTKTLRKDQSIRQIDTKEHQKTGKILLKKLKKRSPLKI